MDTNHNAQANPRQDNSRIDAGDANLIVDVGAALATVPQTRVRYQVREGVVYLSGTARSEDQRNQIERLVRDVPGVRDVANDLDVAAPSEVASDIINDVEIARTDAFDNDNRNVPWIADPGQDEPETGTSATGRALSPGTTDEPSLTDVTEEHRSEDVDIEDISPNAVAVYDTDLGTGAPDSTSLELEPDFTDDVGTTDPHVAAQEGVPYFPPTDPVIIPNLDAPDKYEVVGGVAVETDTPEQMLGNDEDIEERVRYELRRNAMTTDLHIRVHVRSGVVTLRGRVTSLEEAEEAEAIAAGVDGVLEVNEELDIVT